MTILGPALLMVVMQTFPLQGIVLKKGTNEPLSDATVQLQQDQENGAVLKKLTTEDDGRFVFENVAAGRYRVTVTRRGYTRPPLTITVGRQGSAEALLPVSPGATISARVYDANGQPSGHVEVIAMTAS